MESMPGHDHPTTAVATPELAASLRARGLRMTPQREQVLGAVRELGHATPEQIRDAVTDVDLTTVYRTLELLEELQLVRHTHLGHGAPSYRPAGDDHIHVVCHTCGAVVDADPSLVDQLADQLRADRGFLVDRSHLTVFGQCGTCAGGTKGGREAMTPTP
jgi:Fur family transcriptional regulator, ferric uptake regulator